VISDDLRTEREKEKKKQLCVQLNETQSKKEEFNKTIRKK
jgi:hypothetical protein